MPKEETLPIPLKYIDGARSIRTDLDVMQEKHVDDYWNVDLNRSLSDSRKGFTRFTILKEKPPKGYMWSVGGLAKVQTTTSPDHVWPEGGEKLVKQPRIEKNKNGKTRSQNWTMLDDWEESTLMIQMTKNTRTLQKMRGESWKCLWTRPCRAKRRFILVPGNWERSWMHLTRFQRPTVVV